MTVRHIEFQGAFRRLIDLKSWDDNTVVAWLEDDNHHFGITLVHDGSLIQDIRTATVRYPWTACPGASRPLQALIGHPLFGRCSDIGRLIDMRLQCTHLFDLAGLAIAHAHDRRGHRRYHAVVCRLDALETDAPPDWRRASLSRDGAAVMYWDLQDGRIMRPGSCAGRSVDRGFREWIEGLDEMQAEDAYVLRRAAFVANARAIDMSEVHIAREINIPAVCHSYQPGNKWKAIRLPESRVKWDEGSGGMLSLLDTKP